MILGDYIFSDIDRNPYLINLYTELIKEYTLKVFHNYNNETTLNIEDLLKFADLLSKSTDDIKKQKHNNIAQNIVVLLNSLFPDNIEVKKVYVSVLKHIRNYRGIKEDNYYNADIREFVSEYVEKELYKIGGESEEYFVRDQKEIFNTIRKQKFYSYSGPTSMGKTFVIRKYIINQLLKEDKRNFVIVVPTKALISEITSDFINELGVLLKEKKYKVINSYNEINNDLEFNYIMIYTQERLLSHLINSNIIINYVFIDEAHKLFDKDSRSMLLFKIIDMFNNQDNIPNIYFSAPLIRNPNAFLDLLPEISTKSSSVFEFIPVNQQKYILDLKSGKVKVYNELTSNFVDISIKKIQDVNIIDLIKNTGANKKNLIYCESKKDAIRLAEEYAKNKEKIVCDEEIEKVQKYIKNEIHEDYLLADLISKGVAYHIGYIPNTIRKHIENLFKKNDIDAIFCTSTLLEGVNLPADNLFITVKDNSKIIKNDIDFKNLMGRVGRIKYNLTGNVFVIPYDNKYLIDICSDLIVNNTKNRELGINGILKKSQKQEIVEKLKMGDTYIEKNRKSYDIYESMRYIMNNLISDIVKGKKGIVYEKFKDILTDDDINIIRENFKDKYVPQDLPITVEQIDRVDSIIKNENFIYPADIKYENVLDVLEKMFDIYRWNIYESKATLGKKNNLKYYAVILQKWMLGFSIKQIIKDSIEYYEKAMIVYDNDAREKVDYVGNSKQKNMIINDTLNTIENIILYKFLNYFSKFSKRILEINEQKELENDWVEFIQYGSNNSIVLKIQKQGFSREAAIKIYEKDYYKIIDDKLNIYNNIFEDKDELLVNEANQIKLNNYYIFIDKER